MSIDYCHKHHEYRDTDYVVECPQCEEEHEEAPIINAIFNLGKKKNINQLNNKNGNKRKISKEASSRSRNK